MEAIHTAGGSSFECKSIITTADTFYGQKKQRINELESLALLDGLVPPMLQHKDTACSKIETLTKPAPKKPEPEKNDDPAEPKKPTPKKIIKAYNRQIVFPTKRIESEEELEAYVEAIRKQLKTLMQNCDGIELK